MIAAVSGELLHKGAGDVVVEAAGVGYALSVSAATLDELPAEGVKVRLLARMVVREDALQLYGFSEAAERDLFDLLTGVQGVGPKVALAVLSTMSTQEAESALLAADHAAFQRVPGIGKRTAERLIVELKDKVVPLSAPTVRRAKTAAEQPATELAREALLGLGWTQQQADAMLAEAVGETTEELLRSALQGAGR